MALRMSQLARSSRELPDRPQNRPQAEPSTAPQSAPPPPPPDAEPPPDAVDPLQVYRHLVKAGQSVYDAPAEGKTPDLVRVTGVLRQAYGLLKEKNAALLAETVRHRSRSYTWPERGANTAVLSMRLGVELEFDERRVVGVGLCALMHDLGMLTIPPEVLNSRKLNDEQFALLRRHPLESQRLILGFGETLAWAGKVVIQVHERHNGNGYPRGLRGDQIHELAGIIGLADTYQAMAHPRADRKAMVIYNALSEIINLRNQLFDQRLVKALIHIVSIFPLGSLVQLNNGAIGRVVATSKLHPTRPTLEILLDRHHRRLESPEALDLSQEPMLYITDPAIDEDVLEK